MPSMNSDLTALPKPTTPAKPVRTRTRCSWNAALMTCLLLLSTAYPAMNSPGELLRLAYKSNATDLTREYFVYLPVGYKNHEATKWPVVLFLHGNGQRGNGLDDLDYVLRHGPLMEAWIQRRNLPFIIISPQLPLFGDSEALADKKIHQKPVRLSSGTPPRNPAYPSDLPIQRTETTCITDIPDKQNPAGVTPASQMGWQVFEKELLEILDAVLANYQADHTRVYLTGISMGGSGAFHIAASNPDRWAAIAPIAGLGDIENANKIAEKKIPIWIFSGGKDRVVDQCRVYEMANTLEEEGSPALRLTVHEDMNHDVWKRVYEGSDLFNWFLRYTNLKRPEQEKGNQ